MPRQREGTERPPPRLYPASQNRVVFHFACILKSMTSASLPCAPSDCVAFLAVGNPTIDRDERDSQTYGGSSLYAAIQAAKLGMQAALYGRCSPGDRCELSRLLPERSSPILLESPRTTTFRNVFMGEDRIQHMLDDGGAIPLPPPVRASVCHLCPVADEIHLDSGSWEWLAAADFVSCTPQGAMRHRDRTGQVSLSPIQVNPDLWSRVDLLVINEEEEPFALGPVEHVLAQGGIAVVTLGPAGARVYRGQQTLWFPALKMRQIVNRNGAGDSFAAAMAIALARGDNLEAAAATAIVASGLSLRSHGVQGIASQQEVLARLGNPAETGSHPSGDNSI